MKKLFVGLPKELFDDLLSILLPSSKLIMWTSVLAGLYTGFAECVERFVWAKHEAYILVVVMIALDFIFGIWVAIRHNAFSVHRLPKTIFTFIGYTAVMMLAYNLAKADMFYVWLPEVVFIMFTSTKLLSVLKNMALLGFIPRAFALFIISKIDAIKDKIINTDRYAQEYEKIKESDKNNNSNDSGVGGNTADGQ